MCFDMFQHELLKMEDLRLDVVGLYLSGKDSALNPTVVIATTDALGAEDLRTERH